MQAFFTGCRPLAAAPPPALEHSHWGAFVTPEDDGSGLVESYEVDVTTVIPASLAPLLRVLLQWDVDDSGALIQRAPPSRLLGLKRLRSERLQGSLRDAARGQAGFGMVVLSPTEETAAGHVMVFCIGPTGPAIFLDASLENSGDWLFTDFSAMKGVYQDAGFHTDEVFYIFCNGQVALERPAPTEEAPS